MGVGSLWRVPDRPHLAFPVALAKGGGLAVNEQDSDEEVAGCIDVVLSWPIGTRRGSLDFGTPDQLFVSGGPNLIEIREAVRDNEPRADDVSDELISSVMRGGVAQVRLGFDQRGGE